MSCFGLWHQDADDKNQWKLRTKVVGLYLSSALAPAKIRPFLQIRLKSGSGKNWA